MPAAIDFTLSMPFSFSMVALLLVAIFCGAQAVRDVKRKDYGWAIAGFICIAILLLTPLPPKAHAVKVDLPRTNQN